MGIKEDDEFFDRLESEQDEKGVKDPIISAAKISETYGAVVHSNGRVSDHILEIAVNDSDLSKEEVNNILLTIVAQHRGAADTAVKKLEYYAVSRDNKSLYLAAAELIRDKISDLETASQVVNSPASSVANAPSPTPEPIGAAINSDLGKPKVKPGRPKD